MFLCRDTVLFKVKLLHGFDINKTYPTELEHIGGI